MGTVEGDHYHYQPLKYASKTKISGFDNLYIADYFQTDHVNEISSFGYMLNINNKNIYYSGDSSTIDEDISKSIHGNEIDFAYIDTCKADYEGNVHLSLRELADVINIEHRSKIWCMHLDEDFSIKEAEELGFNVVENEFQLNKHSTGNSVSGNSKHAVILTED